MLLDSSGAIITTLSRCTFANGLTQNLAVKNIEYIVATIKGRFGALKLIAMKILFDILMAHDAVLLRKEAALVGCIPI